MAKLGSLHARVLIDADSASGAFEVGTFDIPLTLITEQREGNRVGVRVELPEDAVKAALQQWASELAEALA